MNSDLQIFYVTCADKSSATDLCKTLMSKKLVACGNILDGMTSLYMWNGELREDHEVVLILKTSKSMAEECGRVIKELHTYETPCVLSWTSHSHNEAYSNWIEEQVR